MSILKYENTLIMLSPDILFQNGLERAFTYENSGTPSEIRSVPLS